MDRLNAPSLDYGAFNLTIVAFSLSGDHSRKLYNVVSQIGKARFRDGERRFRGRQTGNERGRRNEEGRHAPMGASREKTTKAPFVLV